MGLSIVLVVAIAVSIYIKKDRIMTILNRIIEMSNYDVKLNSDSEDQWYVLVTVSRGFQDMFENWLLYFCNLNLSLPLIVIAEDNHSYDKYCKIQNIRLLRAIDPVITRDSMPYDSVEYKIIARKRPSHLLRVFRPEMKLILTDIDTVWLKDPTPYFKSSHDMWVALDRADILCAGFIAMRYTPSVLSFLKAWENALKSPALNQPLFNKLIKTSNVSLGILPGQSFPPGIIYFGLNFVNTTWRENVVVVHNNWIIGHGKKVDRFRKAGLWTYSPSLQLESRIKFKCNHLHVY